MSQPEQVNIIISPLPGRSFKSLRVGCAIDHPAVGWLELARPGKFNAFDAVLWSEFPEVRGCASPTCHNVIVMA